MSEASFGGERVVVAMSGGVDSSVAAALIAESGAETIGVTMRLSESGSRCCSLEDADDARRVAERLGIRFFVANYAEAFGREVVEGFADAYLAGRTPIPCIVCNQRFKFDHLLERARVFGADRVATGHYARIVHDGSEGRARLLRGASREKDQSYFLFSLSQAQLRAAWFPIGAMSKQEVRQRARALGFATAEKPESQEICFVPDGDYARVVEQIRPGAARLEGEIVDESGRVLGRHRGVHHFTVGQRHGLGISSDRRLYVLRLDPREQKVVVGERSALDCGSAFVEGTSWTAGLIPTGPVRA
ncbi:MAG: tRNA 2-thiouridine(34) synthase MnmA, partial [Deltaproteobacteria bacterium]|nr:tRNA 2-thiouridine(34) synthase MnmA [Deltaproteobacteria bacterium]